MSRVGVRIAEEVSEAHGRKRVIIVEEAFVELDHDPDGKLTSRQCPSVDGGNQLGQGVESRNYDAKAESRSLYSAKPDVTSLMLDTMFGASRLILPQVLLKGRIAPHKSTAS